MKITVYRSSGFGVTRDYDLTDCSVEKLEKQLLDQCKEVDIDPLVAGIALNEEQERWHIIKRSCVIISLRDTAIKLLKYADRDHAKEAA